MTRGILSFLVALTAAVSANAGVLGPQGAEDRIIVAYRAGVSSVEAREAVAAQGLQALDEIIELRMVLAQASAGKSEAAMVALRSNPAIWRVDRDIWRTWIDALPIPFPTAPPAALRESLDSFAPQGRAGVVASGIEEAQWGVKRVNAPAAWPTNQGAGVKVAIVDTGIDPEHPDLKGRIVGGYNAVAKGQPWADDHFHGTHVAGIVAGELNGSRVAGVAPQASLYAVKVLTKEGSGSLFGIMDGINWCSQNGMQVMNMSLGAAQEMPLLQYALQMAVSAGVTLVAAAGNDSGAVNYPAAYPEAIAVSALDETDGIAKFSSRGPQVAFIAPGVKIPSSVPLSHDPSGVKAYSGTSMATPHVAGLAALAVAKGAQGAEAVRAALTKAARKLPNLGPSEQGAGVVDAANLR